MGRLPLQFAGKDITFRVPYNIYSDFDFTPNQPGQSFPEASFLHNVDKPFEIHRFIPKVTGLDSDGDVMEPQPTTLDRRVFIRIQDTSKNQALTKNATPIDSFLKANELTWEWDEPYTLVRSEELQIQVDVDTLPTICSPDPETCEATPVTTAQVRLGINLQGWLLIIAPPTENR